MDGTVDEVTPIIEQLIDAALEHDRLRTAYYLESDASDTSTKTYADLVRADARLHGVCVTYREVAAREL